MTTENLSESFIRDRNNIYSINHDDYSELTPAQARVEIKEIFEKKIISVSPSSIKAEVLNSIGYSSGKIFSQASSSGIVWVKCYHDGTDNTGEIEFGKPVVLDTVTGKAVTGINETWNANEYKKIGTAWKSFSNESTGSNSGLIPIKIESLSTISDIAPKIQCKYFEQDYSVNRPWWHEPLYGTIDYLPAYGVAYMFPYVGDINLKTYDWRASSPINTNGAITWNGKSSGHYYVNGPEDFEQDEIKDLESDETKPRLALYSKETGKTPVPGETWGVITNDHRLWPHVPGFKILEEPFDDEYSSESGLVLVTRDTSRTVHYTRTTADAHALSLGAPTGLRYFICSKDGSEVYNGTSSGWPHEEVNINSTNRLDATRFYPYMHNTDSTNLARFVDAIQIEHITDAVISIENRYRHPLRTDFIASMEADMTDSVHNFKFDNPLYTIRPFINPNPPEDIKKYIPEHWALCDGSDNAAGAANSGGSGIDLRGLFIYYTTGAIPVSSYIDTLNNTKSHIAGFSFEDGIFEDNATEGSLWPDLHDNQPPYIALAFIERTERAYDPP